MPSIWITSKSRPERSDAIHSFMRAADSATNRRETADFVSPAPENAGSAPPGSRNDRANLRVATLISIWSIPPRGGGLSSPQARHRADHRSDHEMHEGRRQTGRRSAYAGSRLKLSDASGRSRLKRQPFSRTGENP